MPLPLIPLAIKGLFVIGKAVLAHGAAAKVGFVLAKAVSAYGLSATVGGVMTVGIVVGSVVWARERVDQLKAAFIALERNNVSEAITHFARLAVSLHTTADALPHAVHDYLITINTAQEKASAVSRLLRDMSSDISSEIRRIS